MTVGSGVSIDTDVEILIDGKMQKRIYVSKNGFSQTNSSIVSVSKEAPLGRALAGATVGSMIEYSVNGITHSAKVLRVFSSSN